jgi:hypothetical protein
MPEALATEFDVIVIGAGIATRSSVRVSATS